MSLFKALTGRDEVRGALCRLAALYIRIVYLTGRWTVAGGDVPAGFWDRGSPFILAFWHGRILMMPRAWRPGVAISMLISQHRDGQIIARTVSHFGIDTVAGSSSRGGSAALRAMLKTLKAGRCVGITPDGPRGPRMTATDGIAQLARLSGAPVIPCSYSVSRRRVIGSWDRFILAWPFSRGIFLWGAPIRVAADAGQEQIETARRAIEDSLNALTDEADSRMGHRPVERVAAMEGGR